MGSIWQREYVRDGLKASPSFSAYEPINAVMPMGSPVAV
jgi:hypothetical protein